MPPVCVSLVRGTALLPTHEILPLRPIFCPPSSVQMYDYGDLCLTPRGVPRTCNMRCGRRQGWVCLPWLPCLDCLAHFVWAVCGHAHPSLRCSPSPTQSVPPIRASQLRSGSHYTPPGNFLRRQVRSASAGAGCRICSGRLHGMVAATLPFVPLFSRIGAAGTGWRIPRTLRRCWPRCKRRRSFTRRWASDQLQERRWGLSQRHSRANGAALQGTTPCQVPLPQSTASLACSWSKTTSTSTSRA